MIIIAALIIAVAMVLSAIIISFSFEDTAKKGVSLREASHPILEPFKKKEMAEIIKRGDPVDEFLNKNEP